MNSDFSIDLHKEFKNLEEVKTYIIFKLVDKLAESKGNSIYLFTDGIGDQFGGEHGKKFRNKQLKELILSSQKLSLPKQKEIISNTFNNWMGEHPQVDDICIIGLMV